MGCRLTPAGKQHRQASHEGQGWSEVEPAHQPILSPLVRTGATGGSRVQSTSHNQPMKVRAGPLLPALAILIGGCARTSASPTTRGTSDAPRPSQPISAGHQPKRLPDIVLRGHARSGALGPVNEPLKDTISFDDALGSAKREDEQPDAKTVQVILGSADPKPLHWDSEGDLFYLIKWAGVCIPLHGPPGSSLPPCYEGDWGTVIDAHSGAFIVGGTP